MRFPNKKILSELYSCPDKHFSVVLTARFSYRLYRDVLCPGYDIIQRTSLRDPLIIDQVAWFRPKYFE